MCGVSVHLLPKTTPRGKLQRPVSPSQWTFAAVYFMQCTNMSTYGIRGGLDGSMTSRSCTNLLVATTLTVPIARYPLPAL